MTTKRIDWLLPTEAGSVLTLEGPPFRPRWLTPGTPGDVLALNGALQPVWVSPSAATLPINAPGDLVAGDLDGLAVRLPRGTTGQRLTTLGTGLLGWEDPSEALPPGSTGSLLMFTAPNVLGTLVPGLEATVLAIVGGVPAWATLVPPGLPITTRGDLIVGDAGGDPVRLPRGLTNQILGVTAAGDLSWRADADIGFANPMTAPADLIVGDVGGAAVRLAKGADTQVLTVVAGALAWQSPASGGMTNPMTAPGDVIIGASAGAPARLAIGGNAEVLTVVGGVPAWQAPTSGGMTNPMTTLGDLIRGGASGAPVRLAAAANGVLQSNGVGVAPSWFALGTNGQVLGVASGALAWLNPFVSPMTTLGDLITGAALGVAQRLGIGTASQVLTVVGGLPAWAALPIDPGFANPMTGVGDLIRGGPAGVPTRLAPGTNGHWLTLSAGVPTWTALPVDPGFANPMTTAGDMIQGGAAGVATRLAAGVDGQVLAFVGGVPTWTTPPPVGLMHGAVQLRRAAGQLELHPYNGNGLLVKTASGWYIRTIPAGGLIAAFTSCVINGVAAQPIVPNTTYLVTVGDIAGTLTLHLWTATGHAPDADTGVEIKTGDPTQTVVGLVRANASASIVDLEARRFVASWFNRIRRSLLGTFTADRSTSSVSSVELHSEIRVEWVNWGDSPVEVVFRGSVANTVANTRTYTALLLDGVAVPFGLQNNTTSAAGFMDAGVTGGLAQPSEGYHWAQVMGGTVAGSATWYATYCAVSGSLVS